MESLGGLPAPSLRWEVGSTVVPWASLTTPTPLAPTLPAPHRPQGGPERSCQMLTAANYCPGVLQLELLTHPTKGPPRARDRGRSHVRCARQGARRRGLEYQARLSQQTPQHRHSLRQPRPARDARARAPVHPSRSRPPCARPRGVGEGFLKGPTRVVTHQPVGERGVTAPGASARSAESSAARSRSSDAEQRRRRVHAAWAAPQDRDPLVRAGEAAAGGGDAAERPSRLDGC